MNNINQLLFFRFIILSLSQFIIFNNFLIFGNTVNIYLIFIIVFPLNFNKSLAYIITFIFTLISLFIFLFILVSDDRFFFRYSCIIYLLGIILLVTVLIFGNEVKGAKSWFSLMGFSLQPSEFMKPIIALALAKYLSNINSDLKRKSIQLYIAF